MIPAAGTASTQARPELRITRSGVRRNTAPRPPGSGDSRFCVGARQARPQSGSAIATIRAAVGNMPVSVGAAAGNDVGAHASCIDVHGGQEKNELELEPCGW